MYRGAGVPGLWCMNGKLLGRTALVTGATDGIGLVIAREIAAKGARVLLVGRSERKGQAACQTVRQAVAGAQVEFHRADLSATAEVADLATRVRGATDRLDLLVNNAGATFTQRQESADGIEMTFALNHLGYFGLTLRLLDLLRASSSARIVNTASFMHKWGSLDFDDLHFRQHYSGIRAYARSKLCNVLFTHDLARRLADSTITVNAVHPGVVRSNFANNNGVATRMFFDFVKLVSGIGVEAGARTSVYLATSSEVEGKTGLYFSKSKPARTARESQDRDLQARLWTVSAELAKIDL
jgi:retinol dehydrogenase-12